MVAPISTLPTLDTLRTTDFAVVARAGSPANFKTTTDGLVANGFFINVFNPVIPKFATDFNYRRAMDLTMYTDSVSSNPTFTNEVLEGMQLISIHGQYSYGSASGTTAKTTFTPQFINHTCYASGQKFVTIRQMIGYGMGDTFLENCDVHYYGGPVAGDEGQGFWSQSQISQGQQLAITTISSVDQTTTFSSTIIGFLTGSKDPQTVTVVSTSGINVGDWIIIYPFANTAQPNIEAVQITAVDHTGNTITGVFKNKQLGGTQFSKALVLTVGDPTAFGQGRLLVNLTQSPITAGTVSSISGSTFTGSGTSWSTGMVGGSTNNIGAISLDNDTYNGIPFNGTGNQGPIRSWYQVSTVASSTSLTIFSNDISTSGNYRGHGAPSTYVVRPAATIIKINSTKPGAFTQLICESSTMTWSPGDTIECVICPYPDVTAFNCLFQGYTAGGSYRAYFNMVNSGCRTIQRGLVVDGFSRFTSSNGGDPVGFGEGVFVTGAKVGLSIGGVSEAAIRLTAIDTGAFSDLDGRIDWSGRYIQPNSTTGGFDFQMINGNSGGSSGFLQTCNAGFGYGKEVLAWTGIFQLSCQPGPNTDPALRFADRASPPFQPFGVTLGYDFQYRKYTSSNLLGAPSSNAFLDIIYHDFSGDITPLSIGPNTVSMGPDNPGVTTSYTTNKNSSALIQFVNVWGTSAVVPHTTGGYSLINTTVDNIANNGFMHWNVIIRTAVGVQTTVLIAHEDGRLAVGSYVPATATSKQVVLDPTGLTDGRVLTIPDINGTNLTLVANHTPSGTSDTGIQGSFCKSASDETVWVCTATNHWVQLSNGGGGGSGTVTSVATDSTLTGGAITTTGTLGLNLSNSNTWLAKQIFNTGTYPAQGTWMYENSSSLTNVGKVANGTLPTILTLQVKSSSSYYQLGYIFDGVGSIGNYIDSNKSLFFDHYDNSGTYLTSNYFLSFGGFACSDPTSACFPSIWALNTTIAGIGFNVSKSSPTSNTNVILYNLSGNVGVGTSTTISARLHTVSTTEQLRIGYDASNYSSLTVGSTGNLTLTTTGPSLIYSPSVATTGSPTLFKINGAAHTTLTASTEAIDVDIALNRTVQFATGSLTTQRATVFRAPTYGFVGASTITNAATVAITGAPALGTNATFTNAYSMWVQAGKVRLDGALQITTSPTNGYVLTSDASGNATWQAATGGSMAIGGAVTSGSAQEILFVDSSGNLGQNPGFKYNPSPSGSSTTSNFLNISGTQPTSLSAGFFGVEINITGAGSSNQPVYMINASLAAGYTGANQTLGMVMTNSSAGTGADALEAGNGNFGAYFNAGATTTGDNNGIFGHAFGGNRNFGVIGNSISDKNSATSVGVIGLALNAGTSAKQVAGYFGLQQPDPTFASCALCADNGATSSPIALFRANGTTKVTIDSAGKAIFAGDFQISTSPTNNYVLTSDASGNASWQPAGSGTVTSIVAGSGLSGGTITSTGTITLDVGHANTWTATQNLAIISVSGTATVGSGSSLKWDALNLSAATLTMTGSTNVTTSTGLNLSTLYVPTITSGSAVTVSNSATLAIVGPPVQAGSTTITNAYSLWVQAGKVKFDGGFQLSTSPTSGYVLTADSSGNGTWQAPTGGGGSLINARNTSDITNSATSFSNIADCTITLGAGKKYSGKMSIKCSNSVPAEGIKFDFNGGTATMTDFWAGLGNLANGGSAIASTGVSASLSGAMNYATITGECVFVIEFSIICNAGGTLIPRYAEDSHSTGTVTIRKGTMISIQEMSN